MTFRRIFQVTQSDTSQNYGVGKYISEITKQAIKSKDKFELIILKIGVANLVHSKKIEKNSVIELHIPLPFGQEKAKQILTGDYSNAVFCIINDFFVLRDTDIFHFNNPEQSYLLHQIKEDTSAKIIYTLHTCLWKVFYNNDFNSFMTSWISDTDNTMIKRTILAEKKNCELADRIICLNDETIDDVNKIYKPPKSKIKKVPNGIAIEELSKKKVRTNSLREELNIAKDYFVFLYVGRINRHKGILTLLEVFKEILQAITTHIKLIVVGDGELLSMVENQNRKFQNHIVFTGYVDPLAIPTYYLLADAMVFPSINEQGSYVVLEAIGYGIPTILTRINAFNFLEHGVSTLKSALKTPGTVDADELMQNMIRLHNDATLRERIIKNAYSLYLNQFTAEKMFQSTYKNI